MSRDAGVVRDRPGLLRLLAGIEALAARHGEALPLVAARMTALAALNRHESRGAHCRSDYPQTDRVAQRTFTVLPQNAAVHPEPAE